MPSAKTRQVRLLSELVARLWALMVAGLLLAGCVGGASTGSEVEPSNQESFTERRMRMVDSQIENRGIQDERVLAAMRKVPRHLFVPSEFVAQAYNDHPLPIGESQTISQPYIVALMTERLDLEPGQRVLEVGTGSGYQAAALAELTEEVYTVEILEGLGGQAAARLRDMGYVQIRTKVGDGYYGWPEFAPFDAIIVTAAPDHVPQPLVQQLKEGGRMVIPVGTPGAYQTLWLFHKRDGKLQGTDLGGVTFVPFTRGR